MMQIKALAVAAACALVLPAFAADSSTDAAKAVDKAKAEAKADAKKPAVKEKVAGQVSAPAVAKDTAEAANGATAPRFTLRDSRWVRDEDKER